MITTRCRTDDEERDYYNTDRPDDFHNNDNVLRVYLNKKYVNTIPPSMNPNDIYSNITNLKVEK